MKVLDVCELITDDYIGATVKLTGKLKGIDYYVPANLTDANEYIMGLKVTEIRPLGDEIIIYAIEEENPNKEAEKQ